MKTKIFLSFILLQTFFTSAQNTFINAFGTTPNNIGSQVQQTTDGGYVIVGSASPDSTSDVSVVKLNSQGDTVWAKNYGGTADDYGNAIQQSTDGGYIIAGSTTSFGAGTYDVYVIKTNQNGDTLWTKTYGGAQHEVAHAVQQTSDGGYILAGYTNSFVSSPDSSNLYLVKIDAIGNVKWTKSIGGINYNDAYSMQITADKGFILGGYTGGYTDSLGYFSGGDIYIVKTDSLGNLSWAKSYPHVGSEWCTGVIQTTDGGYALTGYSDSFGYGCIIKTDAGGNILWQKGIANQTLSIKQTSDGGYIVPTISEHYVPGGSMPIFRSGINLVKFNALGDTIWTSVYGNPNKNSQPYYAINTTDNGYCVLASEQNTTINLMLIKTDSLGQMANNCFKTTDSLILKQMSLSATTVTPSVNATATIKNNTNTTVSSSSYFLPVCSSSSGIEKITANNYQIKIYPNPTTGNFIIETTDAEKQTIHIFDINGKQVLTQTINGTTSVDTGILNAGVYNVNINGVINKRLVIVR